MSTASFAIEQRPRSMAHLDIAPPPGLEYFAPSKPRATRAFPATATAKYCERHEDSPMFLDPVLLEPLFMTASELDPFTIYKELMFGTNGGVDNVPDGQLDDPKATQLPPLPDFSQCSTVAPMDSYHPSWAWKVGAETVMSASTTGSAEVSPHASESSASEPLPFLSHDNIRAGGFCGTYSIGSVLHAQGLCKPCDFSRRGGCRAGVECIYCHLCTAEDAKRKKKETKKAFRRLRK
eukprot:TRINITY_DN9473_c0_g1_i2.p1 TRINITY_DN9473_c0_g1~~TRINITY_DN9473_c0_g1_i2.p1  ORF type:complete len:247 (+),score=29.46 TRINITY_DN9473_c0_g1_i2:35-742(+)